MRFPARDWAANSTTDAGTWPPGSPIKPFKRDSHAAGLSQRSERRGTTLVRTAGQRGAYAAEGLRGALPDDRRGALSDRRGGLHTPAPFTAHLADAAGPAADPLHGTWQPSAALSRIGDPGGA